MDPETWKALVGARITERRRQREIKSMRQAAILAGVHEATWRSVENGRKTVAPGVVVVASPDDETKVAMCRVLQWTPDSIDRLIEGDDPVEVEPLESEPSRSDSLREIRSELVRLTEQLDRLLSENDSL